MKRQMTALFLALIIVAGVTVSDVSAATVSPLSCTDAVSLNYSGTTATCTSLVIKVASKIEVTMTLWQGNRRIAIWTESGFNSVRMSKQCAVSKGQTYTLIVSCTIDGKVQPSQSISKTNI